MIAISYRREDSPAIAGRLYDRLQAKFGSRNVFMDFDSIPAGVDFREHIISAIERSHAVVAVIGPKCLGTTAPGLRRIDDPNDFVRIEISSALQRGVPVIPVLIDDAPMPSADELPPELRPLAYRNAIPLDSGLDFHSHAQRLIEALRLLSRFKAPQSRSWSDRVRPFAITLAAIFVTAWVAFASIKFFKTNQNPTKTNELPQGKDTPTAGAISTPAPSPAPSVFEHAETGSPRVLERPTSPAPLRAFRGRWSSVDSNPVGGGTMTVRDELVVEEHGITETIVSHWVANGTTVFRMTMTIRYGELWAINNELTARCLAADVSDLEDPKDFGKYSNIAEQATNAAKAGVNLVYTWKYDGTALRRGGTTWERVHSSSTEPAASTKRTAGASGEIHQPEKSEAEGHRATLQTGTGVPTASVDTQPALQESKTWVAVTREKEANNIDVENTASLSTKGNSFEYTVSTKRSFPRGFVAKGAPTGTRGVTATSRCTGTIIENNAQHIKIKLESCAMSAPNWAADQAARKQVESWAPKIWTFRRAGPNLITSNSDSGEVIFRPEK